MRPEHPCNECGNATRNVKFCSQACSKIGQTRPGGKKPPRYGSCQQCMEPFEIKSTKQKFCSHRCSAVYSNEHRTCRTGSLPKERPPCRRCGDLVNELENDYCSVGCSYGWPLGIKTSSDYLTAWLKGEVTGSTERGELVNTVERYIRDQLDTECSICHITDWRGVPVPLVLDHIDGNSTNNTKENLRLVCGNCDMQLPTYKAKNRGSGRHYRRQRYAEGKSY